MYEGGVFQALLRFPETYPMDPPSLQFLTKIYHPNIYRDGKVCISTLQTPPPEDQRNPGDDIRCGTRSVCVTVCDCV
jgi:ubiquitin-protein ligase